MVSILSSDWKEGDWVEADYDRAVVCENGHPINSSAIRERGRTTKRCKQCGSIGVSACTCGAPILGDKTSRYPPKYVPPVCCHECGEKYPWTIRKAEGLRHYVDELPHISYFRKRSLKQLIADVVVDSPRTPAAAQRFANALSKIAKAERKEEKDAKAAEQFGEQLIALGSETVKRIISAKLGIPS